MEKLLLAGLAVAFGAFAAKVGLALSTIRNRKTILITAITYKLLFLLPAMAGNILRQNLYPIAKYGVAFHMLISMGLIVWALWGRNTKTASKVMIAPCPFCIMAVMISVITGAKITGESVFIFSLKAYVVFAGVATMFYIMGRKTRIRIETVMMGAGIYYLTLIAFSYHWKEVSKIYRLSLNSFKFPHRTIHILPLVATPLIAGFLRSGTWRSR